MHRQKVVLNVVSHHKKLLIRILYLTETEIVLFPAYLAIS